MGVERGMRSTPGIAADRLAADGLAGLRQMRWRPAFEFWLSSYRRVWRASIFSGFLSPLLYLGSLGFGLGSLVDGGGTGRINGVSYLAFVAPGILAANAMQTAFSEATYPVLQGTTWGRQYHAQLASPLTTTDVFAGHLAFVGFRVVLGATAFLTIGSLLGGFASIWAILALPVAVLCGLAYAGPVMAFAVAQETDSGFPLLYRFAMVPMFLFAGTFFPLDQLPIGLQALAWLTPVWHGTSLCRDLALGSAGVLSSLGHLAYLAAWTVAGVALGARAYRAKLGS
jgi:lipooligosaccharide transport system permease protein